MEFHLEDVIISLINIVVLFILLRLILWKHVIRFLSERTNRVQTEKDDIEKSRLEAETLHDEYKEKLNTLEEQGQEIIRKSREKAGKESENILKETREKARLVMLDAEARIEEEKETALEEIQVDVTQLATEMAARILKREVSQEDNVAVVDDFFRK